MSAQILDTKKTAQKIKRIALEILERNLNEPRLIIVGIQQTGFELAQEICSELQNFSGVKQRCYPIRIYKPAPLEQTLSCELTPEELIDSVVILIDDVQNSGKTMAYALRYFLDYKVKAIQTCVLVDRRHNSFPVRADYVGLSLSTTLKEHVQVEKTSEGFTVYLS